MRLPLAQIRDDRCQSSRGLLGQVFLLVNGQDTRHRGALTDPALDVQLTAMHLDQRTRDREPKPRPLASLGQLIFDLFKRFPKPPEIMLCNSDPRVGDRNPNAAAIAISA